MYPYHTFQYAVQYILSDQLSHAYRWSEIPGLFTNSFKLGISLILGNATCRISWTLVLPRIIEIPSLLNWEFH